jgi:glycerol-3-phosphate dehydrogenase (NAD(P)+)
MKKLSEGGQAAASKAAAAVGKGAAGKGAAAGKVAVVGSGSFGTAIAAMLADKGCPVTIYARRKKVASGINSRHRNPEHLSDVELPETLKASDDIEEAIDGAQSAVIAVPSVYLRGTSASLKGIVGKDMPLVVLSKGLEKGRLHLMNEVVAEELGDTSRTALLSGPNHAEELALRIPSATVVASESKRVREYFQDLIHSDFFRVYTSSDVKGVGICGAAKNIIAIASGIVYGYGFGDNTAAVIMTRGSAEIARLVVAAGGSPMTPNGLAGIGDLIVTCSSAHSRNRRFGEFLGRGGDLEGFKKTTNMVVEGTNACEAVLDLADILEVEMPICQAVSDVVFGGLSVRDAVQGLLSRPRKDEF